MIKMIAFDFDGTLADSVNFCLEVYTRVFQKYMGEAAPTREQIYAKFGMNEPGMLRYFMGKVVPEAEQEYFRLHRELHEEYCPAPFPEVDELLLYLKGKGVRLGLLTGRCETTCQITMEFFKMDSWFESVQTGSAERMVKADQLKELLERCHLQPEELVYVGDTVSDAEASHEAGVRCLSAAWGSAVYLKELEAVNPGLVFRSMASMKEWLKDKI